MISAGGSADLTFRTRVRCAWNKFKELPPILTARGASLKLKEKNDGEVDVWCYAGVELLMSC